MSENEKIKLVTGLSIEVIVNSIIKEAAQMGFKKEDYIKLVNTILDKALSDDIEKVNTSSPSLTYLENKLTDFPLTSDRIMIRRINKEDDLPLVSQWLDDDLGRNFLLTRSNLREYTLEDLIDKKEDLLGVICLKDGKPIGLMAFLDIDRQQLKAEMRKLIGHSAYRGKGFGKEASQLWINYGVHQLNLKKLYVNTIEANVRNVRINRDLGFHLEGILKNECYIDGKPYDLLRMGIVF